MKAIFSTRALFGETIFQSTIVGGNLNIIKLIEAFIDVKTEEKNALNLSIQYGHLNLVHPFVEKRDFDFNMETTDSYGRKTTPLNLALSSENEKIKTYAKNFKRNKR